MSSENKNKRKTNLGGIRNVVVYINNRISSNFQENMGVVPSKKLDEITQEQFDKTIKIINDALTIYLDYLGGIKKINELFDEVQKIKKITFHEILQYQFTIGTLKDILNQMKYGKTFIESNINEINKTERMKDRQIELPDLTIPYVQFANLINN